MISTRVEKGNVENKISIEEFVENFIDSSDFVKNNNPITEIFNVLKSNAQLANEKLIQKLMFRLDSEKIYIKQNASLALTALSVIYDLSKFQNFYEGWSKKASVRNFNYVPTEKAPDGTKVLIIGRFSDEGSMIYAIQPPLKTSKPVKHTRISEQWVCIEGRGEFALQEKGINQSLETNKPKWQVFKICPGKTFKINVDTPFQFRNTQDKILKFSIVTTPPYTSNEVDAVKTKGCWNKSILQ